MLINLNNFSLIFDECCARAVGVWILSFVICFPPLVGWKDKREDLSSDNVSSPQPTPPPTSEPEVRNTPKSGGECLSIPHMSKLVSR